MPLFTALLAWSLKPVTALSQAVITAGAIGSVGFNMARSLPEHPSRPVIDYQIVCALTPAILMGVSVGVLLNVLLPSWCALHQ